MNKPTIAMNEDAMEEALFLTRRPHAEAAVAGQAVTPSLNRAAATTAPTSAGTDSLKRLLALSAEKDALEAQIKTVNAERDRITQDILDRWSEDGTQSIKFDGKTVYLRRSVYAKVLDREHIAEAMREAGLDSMLTPNTNTLSAWLREKEENGEPLPPALDGMVGTYERFALGVRSGRQ